MFPTERAQPRACFFRKGNKNNLFSEDPIISDKPGENKIPTEWKVNYSHFPIEV